MSNTLCSASADIYTSIILHYLYYYIIDKNCTILFKVV